MLGEANTARPELATVEMVGADQFGYDDTGGLGGVSSADLVAVRSQRSERDLAVLDKGELLERRARSIVTAAIDDAGGWGLEDGETLRGWIEGTVVDEDGEPLGGATVVTTSSARRSNWRPHAGSTAQVGRGFPKDSPQEAALAAAKVVLRYRDRQVMVQSDAQGRFRLEGLEEGAHRVEAFLEGFSFRAQEGETSDQIQLVGSRIHVYEFDLRLPTGVQPDEAVIVDATDRERELGIWTPDEPALRVKLDRFQAKAVAVDVLRSASRKYIGQFASTPTLVRPEVTGPIRLDLVPTPQIRVYVEDTSLAAPKARPWVRLIRVGQEGLTPLDLERGGKGPFLTTDVIPGAYVVTAGRGSDEPEASESVVVSEGAVDVRLALGELDPERFVEVLCKESSGGTVSDVRFQYSIRYEAGGGARGPARRVDRGPGVYWLSREELMGKQDRPIQQRTLTGESRQYGSVRVDLTDTVSAVELVYQRPCFTTLMLQGDIPPHCKASLEVLKEGATVVDPVRSILSRKDVSAEGLAQFGSLQPGNYLLKVEAAFPDRVDDTLLLLKEITLAAEKEVVSAAIPQLYTVRAQIPDGEPGQRVTLQRMVPAIRQRGGYFQAKIAEDLSASFTLIPEGEYSLEIRSGPGSRRMEFSVPCAEFTFVSMPVNALELSNIEPGKLADQAGLRGGDLVLEVDGEPVTDRNRSTVFGRLREGSARLRIQRAGREQQVILGGFSTDEGGWDELGMRYHPRTLVNR